MVPTPGDRTKGKTMPHALASPFLRETESPLAGRAVLQIIPTLQAGGAERVTLEIAGALADVGARALVATAGGPLVSELQARGGIWVPFPADSRNPVAMLRNVGALAHIIRTERPALVHAQSRAAAWVALGATRLTRTPFMTTFHGGYAGRHAIGLQYNSVMARGEAVIVNSHFTGDAIAALYPWARDRLRVVWPGIDLRAFHPASVTLQRVEALRKGWGVDPDQRIVLMAARLLEWKGPRVLIEAVGLLKAAGRSDIVVILAGDDQGRKSYGAQLDALAATRGVSDIVRRVGFCADMPAALAAASLLVVPSTRPEPFGHIAIEAQAMGKPVVVSDVGALTETVLVPPAVQPEERTGWAVPPGDPAALAAAIGSVLDEGASALDALALRARGHVEQHFATGHMMESVLDAYTAVLDSQGTGAVRHAA